MSGHAVVVSHRGVLAWMPLGVSNTHIAGVHCNVRASWCSRTSRYPAATGIPTMIRVEYEDTNNHTMSSLLRLLPLYLEIIALVPLDQCTQLADFRISCGHPYRVSFNQYPQMPETQVNPRFSYLGVETCSSTASDTLISLSLPILFTVIGHIYDGMRPTSRGTRRLLSQWICAWTSAAVLALGDFVFQR